MEILRERDALSAERIASLQEEHTAAEPFQDYFRKTASFVMRMHALYQECERKKQVN